MKNACKRLFSLMLALVLLVSVVPFQALAAENDGYNVNLSIDVYETEGGDRVKKDLGNWNNISGDVKLADLVDELISDDEHEAVGGSHSDYDCDGWYYWDGSQNELGNKTVADVAQDGWVVLYTNHVRISNSGNEGNPDDGDDGEPAPEEKVTVTANFVYDDQVKGWFEYEEYPSQLVESWDAFEWFLNEGVAAGTMPAGFEIDTDKKNESYNKDGNVVYNIFVEPIEKEEAPEEPKNEIVEVTFIYGRNGEHTTVIPYDVETGNITNGEPIPDAGKGFERWYEKDTGKTFNPEKGADRYMTVIAEYKKNDNNNNNNDNDEANFIFYFETKRGTRVGEYKFTAQKDSYKDVSEKTAQEYLDADQTLYSKYQGNKYEVTNVKGDEFKYDRETGNYFCTVEVREVSNNGGDDGNHEEDFGKDNVRVTFLYDNANKKVDYTFYQKNLNKHFELDDDDALWILKNKTRIDTDKYALPDEDDFEHYYNDGKMQVTIELVEKNRNNVFVKFTYDHDQKGDTVSYKVSDPDEETFSVREAEKLMKEALDKDELNRYELMLKDRKPVVSRRNNGNGTYTYTIALERKRSESKLDITVYVRNDSDDDYDRVINDRTITVYSDETYEDDVFDWINRADRDDRHYSEYDYRIKDHDFDDDKENLKVWLEKRHHEDDDRKIYLQVYMNGDKTSYAKKLTITNSRYITDDGELDIDEAIKIVREYFVPKNSDKDMNFDGLWLQGRDDVFDYDDEHDTINLKRYRDRHETATVVIMANNARLKNNSSNPKTGDEILVAVTVMAVSATALAAAYVLNKKRMAK